MKFCEKIIKLRKDYNLTQQKFADKVGCSRTAISNYESENRFPDIIIMQNICKEFNLPIEYLFLDEVETLKKSNVDIGKFLGIDDVSIQNIQSSSETIKNKFFSSDFFLDFMNQLYLLSMLTNLANKLDQYEFNKNVPDISELLIFANDTIDELNSSENIGQHQFSNIIENLDKLKSDLEASDEDTFWYWNGENYYETVLNIFNDLKLSTELSMDIIKYNLSKSFNSFVDDMFKTNEEN